MMLAYHWAEARRAAGIATTILRPIILRALPLPRRPLYPLLPEEQHDLARRFLAGDRGAGARLLEAHAGTLKSLARRAARLCSVLDEDDLAQIGAEAALRGLTTFDAARGGTIGKHIRALAWFAMLQATGDDDTISIGYRQRQAIRRALKSGGLSGKGFV